MKNKELFNKTVNILVKAYQNDTLQHGSCTACAVGNLVCANMFNGNLNKWSEHHGIYLNWDDVFYTGLNKQQNHKFHNYKGNAKKQIKSTGYSLSELCQIEKAFETADKGLPYYGNINEPWDDVDHETWMFNGLIAVYDILCEIHEINKEEVKKGELVFVKA